MFSEKRRHLPFYGLPQKRGPGPVFTKFRRGAVIIRIGQAQEGQSNPFVWVEPRDPFRSPQQSRLAEDVL